MRKFKVKIPILSNGEFDKDTQKKISDYDAVILENHGVVTVGSTIEAACNLSKMIEEAAKIQLIATTLAGKDGLELVNLKEKFKTMIALK